VPLYDYVCAACGRRFEVIHGVHGEPPASCPLCGDGPVRKAITAASVHYKGSGWAKKERRAAVKTGSASRGAEEGPTDAGPARDAGSSGAESESSPAVPAAASSGQPSAETQKPSTSGAATKTPARDPD